MTLRNVIPSISSNLVWSSGSDSEGGGVGQGKGTLCPFIVLVHFLAASSLPGPALAPALGRGERLGRGFFMQVLCFLLSYPATWGRAVSQSQLFHWACLGPLSSLPCPMLMWTLPPADLTSACSPLLVPPPTAFFSQVLSRQSKTRGLSPGSPFPQVRGILALLHGDWAADCPPPTLPLILSPILPSQQPHFSFTFKLLKAYRVPSFAPLIWGSYVISFWNSAQIQLRRWEASLFSCTAPQSLQCSGAPSGGQGGMRVESTTFLSALPSLYRCP